MSTVERIKDGLQYTIETMFIRKDNQSYLERRSNGITLSCHFSGLDCSLTFGDDPISHHIKFEFHLDYLKGFSSDFDIHQFPENLKHEICCNTQMILHDIITCKQEGVFRNMLMESKALALLLCFQKCNTSTQISCDSCKFLTNKIEREKILKAKEIILSRLNNPPTIPELSVQIGINQCYLKKGFKELFGTTVYDFVQEHRMSKAKMLLSTTDYSVAQVADHIGYSSASNFSAAFKKHVGIFPSELNQN